MRVLRAVALVANGLWALFWLLLAAAFIARQDIVGIFALTLFAFGVITAVVIAKDLRGKRASKPLRISAVILNAAVLALATLGWSTALTGGAGPTNVEGAVAAAVMTVLVALNLIVMLRRVPPHRTAAAQGIETSAL